MSNAFRTVDTLRKIAQRRCDRPRLTIRREPIKFWSSRLSLLGSKQKREQPARWRHRPVRIIRIDARKRRNPARQAAHRGWTVQGSDRCARRVQIDHGSLRFVGAQLVQMSTVFQESGSRRSLGSSHRRRIPVAACERRDIAGGGQGISTFGRKDLIGWSERHRRRACIKYGCLRPVGNPPAQDSHGLGAGDSGRFPCSRRRRRLHRISGPRPARAAAQSERPPAVFS